MEVDEQFVIGGVFDDVDVEVEDLGLVIGDDIDIFAKETIPFLKLVRKEVLLIEEDVFDTGTFLAGAAIHAIRNRGEPPMQSLDVPTRP